MGEIKLLIATDDRDLLVSLLIFLREETDLRVVGTAVDRASVVVLAQSTHPDIVLVDETLFGGGPIAVGDPLDQVDPRPFLIILMTEAVSEPSTLVDAVALKHTSPEMLLDSLRQAAASLTAPGRS